MFTAQLEYSEVQIMYTDTKHITEAIPSQQIHNPIVQKCSDKGPHLICNCAHALRSEVTAVLHCVKRHRGFIIMGHDYQSLNTAVAQSMFELC